MLLFTLTAFHPNRLANGKPKISGGGDDGDGKRKNTILEDRSRPKKITSHHNTSTKNRIWK